MPKDLAMKTRIPYRRVNEIRKRLTSEGKSLSTKKGKEKKTCAISRGLHMTQTIEVTLGVSTKKEK